MLFFINQIKKLDLEKDNDIFIKVLIFYFF